MGFTFFPQGSPYQARPEPDQERTGSHEQRVITNCVDQFSVQQMVKSPQGSAAGTEQTRRSIKNTERVKAMRGRVEAEEDRGSDENCEGGEENAAPTSAPRNV
jgi:hypothetical protein